MIKITVEGDNLDEVHELLDRMQDKDDFDVNELAISMLVKRTDALADGMEVLLGTKANKKGSSKKD